VLTTVDGSVIKERMQAWEMSLLISSQMIRGNLIDITTGSTHYYNSDLANPYWAEHYVQVVQIDSHSFLKSE
jgi:spore germination cell wall hydrolase CwlJ-like protein